MNRPTQKVHIIYGGRYYSFDAVMRLEHQHNLDIAENASDVEEKEHVGYAMLKPSTLTLEVQVSDTVTVSNEPLTQGSGKRSVTAYRNLYNIQRARQQMSIITEKHTFTKMLLETFSVSEDMDTQNSLLATLVFKEMIVTAPKVQESSGKRSSGKPAKKQGNAKTQGSVLSQMTRRDSGVYGNTGRVYGDMVIPKATSSSKSTGTSKVRAWNTKVVAMKW